MCIRYMESDSHLMEHLPMNEKVTRALNRLLRPLVRILYTNGIAFKDFTGLLKCVYIDVVGEDLVAAGEKPTTARIAILTGLTRKDVAELRKQDKHLQLPRRHNRVTRVINGWLNDSDFHDIDGKPAMLVERGQAGSLYELIARYSGDMPARSMVAELQRAGAIEERGRRVWELITDSGIVGNLDAEKLKVLGDDVGQMISTVDHNLNGDGERWFQRKIRYENVPADSLDEFRELSNRENNKLLEKLSSWLAGRTNAQDGNKQVQVTEQNCVSNGVASIEPGCSAPDSPLNGQTSPQVRSGAADDNRIAAGVGVFYFEQDLDDTVAE